MTVLDRNNVTQIRIIGVTSNQPGKVFFLNHANSQSLFHLTRVNIKTHNSLNILYLPALKTSCLDKFWREFSLFLIGIDNIYSYFNKSELLSTNCTIYCAIQFIIVPSKIWLIASFCHCITIHFITLIPSWDKCYL